MAAALAALRSAESEAARYMLSCCSGGEIRSQRSKQGATVLLRSYLAISGRPNPAPKILQASFKKNTML